MSEKTHISPGPYHKGGTHVKRTDKIHACASGVEPYYIEYVKLQPKHAKNVHFQPVFGHREPPLPLLREPMEEKVLIDVAINMEKHGFDFETM